MYERLITAMLTRAGVCMKKLKFVRGTEYQLSKEYTLDVYKLSAMLTDRDARRAVSEVVKQRVHWLVR